LHNFYPSVAASCGEKGRKLKGMISKTRMTIQDYLQHAGVGGAGIGARRNMRVPEPGGDHNFAAVLAQAGAAAATASPTGLRIGDYLRSPVTVKQARVAPAPQEVERQSATGGGGTVEPCMPAEVSPVDSETVASTEAGGAINAAATAPGTPSERARIDRGIVMAAEKYDLPPGLIRSVMRAESNFEVRAVSRAGAQGLMQLMPVTARELGVRDPFDIEQNIDGGARYLRRMLDRFGGDLKRALSAYNAGPGKVERYNGEVPYRETRDYVQKVLAFNERYSLGSPRSPS
jgi:soluble lytic murein transglycosylase-like protein